MERCKGVELLLLRVQKASAEVVQACDQDAYRTSPRGRFSGHVPAASRPQVRARTRWRDNISSLSSGASRKLAGERKIMDTPC